MEADWFDIDLVAVKTVAALSRANDFASVLAALASLISGVSNYSFSKTNSTFCFFNLKLSFSDCYVVRGLISLQLL